MTLHLLFSEWRHALRRIFRSGFDSLLIVAVLAAGLGATMYALIFADVFILHPAPFPNADRLVMIGEYERDRPDALDEMNSRDFLEIRPLLPQVDRMASYAVATMNLSDGRNVERYEGQFVTGPLFDLLGVRPQLGRALDERDDVASGTLPVLISDQVWRRRFGGSPDVIGRDVQINRQPAVVIGVMPPEFSFPFYSDVWAPARNTLADPVEREREGNVVALLKTGVSADQAMLGLRAAWQQLQRQAPDRRRDVTLEMRAIADHFVGSTLRGVVGMILVGALSVLLVACANVANLQLARLSQRGRELAIRSALGAGRGRIVASLMLETLLLFGIATIVAMGLAHLAGEYSLRVFDEGGHGPAYWVSFAITPRVAFVGIGVAFIAAVLSGIAPGWRATDFHIQRALVDQGRAGRGASRLARVLIVAQVACSCMLLIGAGVILRELQQRMRFDLGIDTPTEQLLTARVAMFGDEASPDMGPAAFYERIATRLRAEPGVRAATVSEPTPGLHSGHTELRLDGQPPDAARDEVIRAAVDDAFAETYGVRVLAGRFFDQRDRADTAPVAVVDERFASKYWPNDSVLQRRIQLGQDPDAPWVTVVGVVRTLTLEDVDDPAQPTVLLPMRQAPTRYATVAVHTTDSPAAFAPRLAELMREVDADTPLYWVQPLASALAADRVGERFLSKLFGLFGGIGLMLAGAGLFGVMARAVALRSREIGVRRAVGADARRIVWSVASGSGTAVLVGLLIGFTLGIPWAGVLSRLMSADRGADPMVMMTVALLVVVAAVAAAFGPTRRALAISPTEALRSD